MEQERHGDIGVRIQQLVARLDDLLNWTWDSRFETALAEFSIEQKAEVLAALEELLTCRWDSGGLADAPEVVRDLVKRLGGLMSGQLLLLSDPESLTFLFCAWWPWGNGQTISIRIGPFGKDLPEDQLAALTDRLRKQLCI